MADLYRRARRLVLDPPGGRLVMAAPRTVGFVAKSALRGLRAPIYPDPPAPRPTPGLALQVAMDELILGAMKSPKRYPRRLDYSRVGDEVLRGAALYEERGWVEDPIAYHRTPPPLGSPDITKKRSLGVRYEHLSWESEYEPWPEEPGRDRWQALEANRTAHAYVLRHRGAPRPWLVCVHGFGTGSPLMDFSPFHVKRLFGELGLNVILPVLPTHGPRKGDGFSGEPMMSFDMMNAVFAMGQATWDIRRAVSWVRAQGAPKVGIYGISLGGYATALQVAVEPGYDAAVAAIPATDLPALFAHHCPPRLRRRAVEHHLLGEEASRLHRVISPMAMKPQVPRNRRFIVGGLGDRMSTPKQAYRLWLHWDQPKIAWYGGNHVGYFWSGKADKFVLDSLVESGFSVPPTSADDALPPDHRAPAASSR